MKRKVVSIVCCIVAIISIIVALYMCMLSVFSSGYDKVVVSLALFAMAGVSTIIAAKS